MAQTSTHNLCFEQKYEKYQFLIWKFSVFGGEIFYNLFYNNIIAGIQSKNVEITEKNDMVILLYSLYTSVLESTFNPCYAE